jgi:ribonuclease HI
MGITIYTDGACRGNPGPGGYAAIVEEGARTRELSRGFRWTTNNRMEIQSVIAALEAIEAGVSVHLVSDSQYVLNALSKGWIAGWKRRGWVSTARQPVKNRDQWELLDGLVARHVLTCQWVRGHAAHPFNNRCDEMAVAAALGKTLAVDAGYEAGNPFPAAVPGGTVKFVPGQHSFVSAHLGQPMLPDFL